VNYYKTGPDGVQHRECDVIIAFFTPEICAHSPRLIFMLTTEALEETDGDGDVVVVFKF
jgi:hypothetical protein